VTAAVVSGRVDAVQFVPGPLPLLLVVSVRGRPFRLPLADGVTIDGRPATLAELVGWLAALPGPAGRYRAAWADVTAGVGAVAAAAAFRVAEPDGSE
jgi:hypothetical protein